MMAAPKLRAATLSDVGRTRERNEDSSFAGMRVFAVADGLGGHRAGEIASSLAIESFQRLDQDFDSGAAQAIVGAVQDANRNVYERAQREPDLHGMGTTITAIAVEGSTAHLAHVGDSRCYLIRQGMITQVSQDHTLVARMVDEGKLTARQAESHPQRSILTRALGASPEVDVDTLELELVGGDRILLCSDGLTAVLRDEELLQFATSTHDLQAICGELVDEANARGGPDNITVVLVDVGGPRGATTGAPAIPVPVPQAPPAPRAAARPPKVRRVPLRALVWLGVLLVASIGGALGVRSWVNNSWFVGLEGDRVAIYRGLPTDALGGRLNSVEERTDLTTDRVAAYFVPRLKEGIRVEDLAQARVKVQAIPRESPSATPSAPGSPLPAASASGSPT